MQDALTEVVAGRIWASERPVWFHGVRLRARTSVIRLDDGRLLIHSPAPLSDAMKQQLAELGEVRWLVVPNRFHHLGAPAAAAAFPSATVVAPSSAALRNAALRIDVAIDDPTFANAVPELALIPLEGVPFLDETLLYHRPTETLLGADVVLRADDRDHWTWRLVARVLRCYKRARVPADVKIADKAAAARTMTALRSLPVARLVVAHSEVIADAPLDQLLDAWRVAGVHG